MEEKTVTKLISQDVYDETIELIEGLKEPDEILVKMQKWYAEKGIKLYNLYLENTYKDGKMIGKSLRSLTDRDEDDKSIPYLEADALIYYEEIKAAEGVKYSEIRKLTNFQRLNRGIFGYNFNKIWQEEIINEAGRNICPDIERRYNDQGVKKVVNGGTVYTVYVSDEGVDENTKNMIELDMTDSLKMFDRHKIINNPYSVVRFDTYSSMLNRYNGSMCYY